MFNLKENYGEWAIVVGASEGLGEAFARLLAEKGFNLVLIARRIHLLKSLAAALEQEFAIKLECFQVDVANISELENALGGYAGSTR